MQTLGVIARLFAGTHVPASRDSTDASLLQPRDYSKEDRQLISDGLSGICLQPNLMRYILHLGDVLFASKGRDPFAVVYKGSALPLVPSSSFTVVRIKDPNVLTSDYLCWYLNLPKTQLALHSMAKGTSMPSISTSELAGLPITVPNIETQQRIIHGMDLHAKRAALTNRLQELNQNFLQAQLLQLAKQRS